MTPAAGLARRFWRYYEDGDWADTWWGAVLGFTFLLALVPSALFVLFELTSGQFHLGTPAVLTYAGVLLDRALILPFIESVGRKRWLIIYHDPRSLSSDRGARWGRFKSLEDARHEWDERSNGADWATAIEIDGNGRPTGHAEALHAASPPP